MSGLGYDASFNGIFVWSTYRNAICLISSFVPKTRAGVSSSSMHVKPCVGEYHYFVLAPANQINKHKMISINSWVSVHKPCKAEVTIVTAYFYAKWALSQKKNFCYNLAWGKEMIETAVLIVPDSVL